jgi:NhaP-type Na+/H+ or K+/H+ antiporter
VRFALTSEAGLNDGLAFPFVNLAIALSLAAETGEPWLKDWVLVDVLWKLGAGVVVGYLVGRGSAGSPSACRTAPSSRARATASWRSASPALPTGSPRWRTATGSSPSSWRRWPCAGGADNAYHQKLHDFAEELERLLMMVLLVMLGGAMSGGALFGR